MKPPSLTLGIEEEYQIIDPETRELHSYITEILDGDHMILERDQAGAAPVHGGGRHQVCRTPAEVRAELVRLRGVVMELAARNGLVIAAAGTHPFSSWMTQEITPLERYLGVQAGYAGSRAAAADLRHPRPRRHRRSGLPDRRHERRALLLPHVLCLSTSSPFWMGRNTGLKSYRSVIFRNFPRTGIPPMLRSATDYDALVDSLVRDRLHPRRLQDLVGRPAHHSYPTLEFRVCDVCTRVDEAVCIAAILQAIVAKIWKLRRDNLTFRIYPTAMIEENKWRAVRFGLDGKLIDFGKQHELPARELIREMFEWFLDDVVDELGSRQEVEYAFQILEHGTSADRQLGHFDGPAI